MLLGLTFLLIFQLIGEIIAYATGGVVPGPVIGMALIAVALGVTAGRPSWGSPGPSKLTNSIVEASNALLANLGVLFVPAGVGVIQHFGLITERGLALLAVIVLSTLATMIATVWAFLAAKRLMGGRAGD